MVAVADLDDPFAATGLTVLRGERAADRRAARPGTGLRGRLRQHRQLAARPAGQARHRTRGAAGRAHPRLARRLDARTAARNGRCRTPVTADRRRLRVRRTRPTSHLGNGCAAASSTPSPPPTSPAPTAAHCTVTPTSCGTPTPPHWSTAGMALPALMALLGHVTPEMTLRYATLASPTIRNAYEAAMGKVRAGQLLPLTAVRAAPPVPDRVAVAARRDAQDQTSRTASAPAPKPPGRAPTPTSASSAILRPGPASRRRDHRPARGRARPA